MMSVFSKWKIPVYLVAIFCAGGVSGWMLGARAAKEKLFSPPDQRDISSHMRDRLHSKLDLSEDQGKKVDALIDKNSREMQVIHSDCMKKIHLGMTSFNAQLKAILTPEQQEKFDEMERQRREARKNFEQKWRHGPPPGPGGPGGWPPKGSRWNDTNRPLGGFGGFPKPQQAAPDTNAPDQH